MNQVLGVLGYEASYLQMFVFLFWEYNELGVGSVMNWVLSKINKDSLFEFEMTNLLKLRDKKFGFNFLLIMFILHFHLPSIFLCHNKVLLIVQ